MKQKVEPIDFHPIPTLDLDWLIGEKVAFDINSVEVFSGSVWLNLSADAIIRVGAFKTAQAAHLMLSPLQPSGLGSRPNHPIIVKRFYIGHEATGSGPPFMRPSLGEELKRLYREANVLYWTKALLKMTYDYVDCSVQDADKPPPFQVPCLRFVNAGLLLAYAERPNAPSGLFSGKWKAGTLSSVYLAEEVIPTSDADSFVKFIHNGDAAPREHLDPAINEIAKFLSFMQHVQYTKTSGQVYVSDYQGV